MGNQLPPPPPPAGDGNDVDNRDIENRPPLPSPSVPQYQVNSEYPPPFDRNYSALLDPSPNGLNGMDTLSSSDDAEPESAPAPSNIESPCPDSSSSPLSTQSSISAIPMAKLTEDDWESLCPDIMNAQTAMETYWCLACFDDICTHLMLDCLYLPFSTLKMSFDHPLFAFLGDLPESIRLKSLSVPTTALSSIVSAFGSGTISAATAVHSIVASVPWLRHWLENMIPIPLACHFLAHLRQYVLMYSGDAGYDIAECGRFTLVDNHQTQPTIYQQIQTMSNGEQKHAMLVATRQLSKGEKLPCCAGQLAALSEDDLEIIAEHGMDFSVIEVSKLGQHCLLAGPLRFANHDCNPNAMFFHHKRKGVTRTMLKILKPVARGHELLVNYGLRYFGNMNAECRCATCQTNNTGAFKLSNNVFYSDIGDTLTHQSNEFASPRVFKRRRPKLSNSPESLSSPISKAVQNTVMSALVLHHFLNRFIQSHGGQVCSDLPFWASPPSVVCTICLCSVFAFGINEQGHVQCDMCARHALVWSLMWPQRHIADLDHDVIHGSVDESVEWIQSAGRRPYLLHLLEMKVTKSIGGLHDSVCQLNVSLPGVPLSNASDLQDLALKSIESKLNELRQIPSAFISFKYIYEDIHVATTNQTSTDQSCEAMQHVHVTNYNQRNLVLAKDDDRWWPAITVPIADWDLEYVALCHKSNYRIQYIGSGNTYSCLPHSDLFLVTQVLQQDPTQSDPPINSTPNSACRIILVAGSVSLELTKAQATRLQKLCGIRLPRTCWPKWHAEHKLLHSNLPDIFPSTSVQAVVSPHSSLYYKPVANLDLVSILKCLPIATNAISDPNPDHLTHTSPSNVVVELPPTPNKVPKSKTKKRKN